MDHCEVCHASIEAIPILNCVDVEEVYSYIPSRSHSLQLHSRSYGWHDVSFRWEDDSMEETLVLRCEASSIDAVQTFH
jgi:hypothetical protein